MTYSIFQLDFHLESPSRNAAAHADRKHGAYRYNKKQHNFTLEGKVLAFLLERTRERSDVSHMCGVRRVVMNKSSGKEEKKEREGGKKQG